MGDFLLLTYRRTTHDKDLAVSFLDAWRGAGRDQFELESFPLLEGNVTILDENDDLDEFMRSDHVALWRDNIPAIFISDSGTKWFTLWINLLPSVHLANEHLVNWHESLFGWLCLLISEM